MKIIHDSKILNLTLSNLIKKHHAMSWAVAWASTQNPVFKLLVKHRRKIDKLVVGTHFYQTDPEFIEYWKNEKRVRFVLATDGVFHPKVYLFGDERRWDCLIGSANFTKAAFETNDEACVLLQHTDLGSPGVYSALEGMINDYWQKAQSVTPEYISNYRRRRDACKAALAKLEGRYGRKPKSASQLTQPGLNWTWGQYVENIKQSKIFTLDKALGMLEVARDRFESKSHFSDLSKSERAEIAGFDFSNKKNIDWGFLGSMRGAGTFKGLINKNDRHISEALDCIPLTGDVEKVNWENYVERLRNATDKGINIGAATRLAAVRRPDYFVTVNSAAKAKLGEALQIAPTSFKIETYWDHVIAPVKDTPWWETTQPVDHEGARIWKCRAALLDMIFYQPTH